MKQKKLLLLGGIRYLVPVVKAAHDLGIYVITADYLPDNIAHKYSDEYCRQEKLASNPQLVYDGELLSGLGASGVTASNIRECYNLIK